MANLIHTSGLSLRVALVGLGLVGLVLFGAVMLGRARLRRAEIPADSAKGDAMQRAAIPPIDAAAPTHTETATFALG
jgi:hypothetical protein